MRYGATGKAHDAVDLVENSAKVGRSATVVCKFRVPASLILVAPIFTAMARIMEWGGPTGNEGRHEAHQSAAAVKADPRNSRMVRLYRRSLSDRVSRLENRDDR